MTQMTIRGSVLVGLILLGAASCSSQKKESGDDDGAGNTGANGPVINLTGGTGAGGPVAQDTEDGLLPITAEQASALADAENVCAGWSAEPEGSGPPILEFAIDVTGSMADLPAYPNDPGNDASRWDEMQRVLPSVFDSLPASWAVGVSYYRKPDDIPSEDIWRCFEPDPSVPIGLMDDAQKSSIGDSLARRGPKPNTTDPDNVQGATPTLAAWRFALSELTGWSAPSGYEDSPRYIVLITDGVPTVNADGCTYVNPITQDEYDQEIEIVEEEGQAAGAKTFVVGVLGSEQTQNATYDPLYMLSRFAVAGGTEEPAGCVPTSGTVDTSVEPSVMTARGEYCHYDLSASDDFAGSLVTALQAITSSVVSCSYTLPPPPDSSESIDPALTNLVYADGNGGHYLLLPNTSDTCDRGWRFTDASQSALEICGVTCDLLQANPSARLNVVFGCRSGEVPLY